MNKKTAVFPGSFDPVTKGHTDIINRGLNIFDEIIIAIGINADKKNMFALEKREQWLNEVFVDNQNVRVQTYTGLTINFCKSVGAKFILRGVRSVSDMEFERSIAIMNGYMASEIETVFLFSDPSVSAISSTIVRDIIRNGGDVDKFVPPGVRIN